MMRKLYKMIPRRSIRQAFTVYEDCIGLDCQKDDYGTDVQPFDRTDFPNYAWFRYAIDFPFKGLFVKNDKQYPNGSVTEDELQAWVGFTDSIMCAQRRRDGWVFWDKARCLFLQPMCKIILPPDSEFITVRQMRSGDIIRFYTHLNGSLYDSALRHTLRFGYHDYGVDWYQNHDENGSDTTLVNHGDSSRSTSLEPEV